MEVLKKLLAAVSGHLDPADSSTWSKRAAGIAVAIGGLMALLASIQSVLCGLGVVEACSGQ